MNASTYIVTTREVFISSLKENISRRKVKPCLFRQKKVAETFWQLHKNIFQPSCVLKPKEKANQEKHALDIIFLQTFSIETNWG